MSDIQGIPEEKLHREKTNRFQSETELQSDSRPDEIQIDIVDLQTKSKRDSKLIRSYQPADYRKELKEEQLNTMTPYKSQNQLNKQIKEEEELSLDQSRRTKNSLPNLKTFQDIIDYIRDNLQKLENLSQSQESKGEFELKLFDLLEKIVANIQAYSQKKIQIKEIDRIIDSFGKILEQLFHALRQMKDHNFDLLKSQEHSKEDLVSQVNQNILDL